MKYYLSSLAILLSSHAISSEMMQENQLDNTCKITVQQMVNGFLNENQLTINANPTDTVRMLRNKIYEDIQRKKNNNEQVPGMFAQIKFLDHISNLIGPFADQEKRQKFQPLFPRFSESTLKDLGLCNQTLTMLAGKISQMQHTIDQYSGNPDVDLANKLLETWENEKIYVDPQIIESVTAALNDSTIQNLINANNKNYENVVQAIGINFGEEAGNYFKRIFADAIEDQRVISSLKEIINKNIGKPDLTNKLIEAWEQVKEYANSEIIESVTMALGSPDFQALINIGNYKNIIEYVNKHFDRDTRNYFKRIFADAIEDNN